MSLATKKPVNYLNNKDILKEIHASKNTYCKFVDPENDHKYDFIVDMPSESIEKSLEHALKDEVIVQAKEARATRLSLETGEKVSPDSIQITDLVFRVMTWDHVPVAPKQPRKVDKKKTAKDIFEFEIRGLRSDQRILPLKIVKKQVVYGNIEHQVLIVSDITQIKDIVSNVF